MRNLQVISGSGRWLCFFQTDTEEKAKKILRKFEERLEGSIKLLGISIYWKDKSLLEVRFLQDFYIEDKSYAVFKVLQYSQSISNERYVIGPDCVAEDKWSFEIIIEIFTFKATK